MSCTPRTRVERTTIHQVADDETTRRVELLHLVDGRVVGYEVKTDDVGRPTYLPADDELIEALLTE